MPSNNPLRSLAEMAGKTSSGYRLTEMDLLRENLGAELARKGFQIALPEELNARFPPFPADNLSAAQIGREGNLSGLIFVTEIWRWEGDPQRFVRVVADFKIVRIDDGTVLRQSRVQRAVPTPSAPYLGQVYMDAVKAVAHDLFA